MELLRWLRKSAKISGSFLGAVDELYNPSAREARIIVEEKREAREASPSPEDKPNKKPAE